MFVCLSLGMTLLVALHVVPLQYTALHARGIKFDAGTVTIV